MSQPFDLPGALFTFHGQVVRGKRLGSRLGFPTANIVYDPRSRAWPREGVYAGVGVAGWRKPRLCQHYQSGAAIRPSPRGLPRWRRICWDMRTPTSTDGA